MKREIQLQMTQESTKDLPGVPVPTKAHSWGFQRSPGGVHTKIFDLVGQEMGPVQLHHNKFFPLILRVVYFFSFAFLRVSSYFNLDFNSTNRIEGRYGAVPIPKLRGSVQQPQGSIPRSLKSFP